MIPAFLLAGAAVARMTLGGTGSAGLEARRGDFSDEQLLRFAIWYVSELDGDPAEFTEDVAIVWDALRDHLAPEPDSAL